jgi:hypothetical protein
MATTPNFNWSTPDNTGLVKNGALDIRTLGNSIDASLVDLKGGTTGQVLAKASNTDMDFSWVAQDDSNAIQNAIVDAKGDLIAATGSDTPARLAVGANDLLLTAASGEATGLKYTGAWTTYTPVVRNGVTVGNGTEVYRWTQIGKIVFFYYSFTLGSTSSFGTGGFVQISLPKNNSQDSWQGTANFTDAGTGDYVGSIQITTNTFLPKLSTSPVQNITTTSPFTWTNTDRFIATGFFEVA